MFGLGESLITHSGQCPLYWKKVVDAEGTGCEKAPGQDFVDPLRDSASLRSSLHGP